MTNQPPLTNQQLDDLNRVAADYANGHTHFPAHCGPACLMAAGVSALTAEVRRLHAALEEIRHLHKDSPMGPCPQCIDADAAAAGGDGLVPYPCPTARLAGAKDCDPPHVRADRYAAAGNEVAASLVRDGFGDDEIADMLRTPPAATDTLPTWLYQRFSRSRPNTPAWDALMDEDRAYWERQARAVRRAVARNGFKTTDEPARS